MDIRRTVKRRLKELGKTQNWLAAECGMHRQGLSRFLRDKEANVSVATFLRMLKVLRLEIRPKQ